MYESNEVSNRIVKLLKNAFLINSAELDVDLVESGVIDSAGFMELFSMLEDEFKIEITVDDLTFDHFRTVASITAFVIDKQKRGPA